jgi:hypothetical protein
MARAILSPTTPVSRPRLDEVLRKESDPNEFICDILLGYYSSGIQSGDTLSLFFTDDVLERIDQLFVHSFVTRTKSNAASKKVNFKSWFLQYEDPKMGEAWQRYHEGFIQIFTGRLDVLRIERSSSQISHFAEPLTRIAYGNWTPRGMLMGIWPTRSYLQGLHEILQTVDPALIEVGVHDFDHFFSSYGFAAYRMHSIGGKSAYRMHLIGGSRVPNAFDRRVFLSCRFETNLLLSYFSVGST